MKEKIRKHYHWLVAIIALLSYIVFGGLTNNLSSMFILPVTEELGISRSAFSVAISLRSMITFVINLFFGFLYRRFGYRKLAICGFAGMAVFLFAMGLATGYGGILCAIPAMGLFGVFCDTANLLQLIRNWFHRHQGMVIGMVTAASGIGGALTSDFTTGWFLSMISLSAMVTQPLMNICYDTFGSYNPFVYGAAGLTVLVFGLYLVIFRMSDKERKKTAS